MSLGYQGIYVQAHVYMLTLKWAPLMWNPDKTFIREEKKATLSFVEKYV